MVMTDAMIEAQSKNREHHQRIVKLMICRANYSSGVPNGVEFAECQDERSREEVFPEKVCGNGEAGTETPCRGFSGDRRKGLQIRRETDEHI